MNKMMLVTALLLGFCYSAQSKVLSYGEMVDMELYQPLPELVTNSEQFLNQRVTIKGKLVKVCKKRGCWADLVSEDSRLRIKVVDGEIVIPIHAIGREAYAIGTLTSRQLSQEQAIAYLEYMAKDAGEAFDPKTVTEGMTLYQLKADGIRII